MIRERLIKAASLVLAVWYLLCVVGFDVHTCGHSGRSFVSSLVVNATADSPASDMICHQAGCCEGDGASCCGHDGVSSGCTDDVFTLSVPAIERSEDEHHHHHNHCTCVCGFCPALADIGTASGLLALKDCHFAIPDSSYQEIMSEDINSVICVWRI